MDKKASGINKLISCATIFGQNTDIEFNIYHCKYCE